MTVQTLFVVKKLSRRIKAENYKLNRLDDLKYKTSQELDGLPKARNGADLIAKIVAEICDKTSLISELKIIRAQCRIELCKLFEKILSGDNFYFELQTVTYRYAFVFFAVDLPIPHKRAVDVGNWFFWSSRGGRIFLLKDVDECWLMLKDFYWFLFEDVIPLYCIINCDYL